MDETLAALTRYVALPSPEAADATALWLAATHAQTAWEHAPRLAIVSPEKRCGKSRLIDVGEMLSHGPVVTVNISPAALVRTIEATDPPTLWVDEADAIWGPKAGEANEDLRGIVNSGHQRGRPYIRYDITTRRNERHSTFCMAGLAGIGDLPDTIMDRAVVVRMRRRAPGETVAPYRTRRDGPALAQLRDRLCQWVTGHVETLTAAEPDMPVEDRAADTWEPLIAVADLAGGDWPARARRAVLVLVAAEAAADVEGSLGLRLLGDIRDTFDAWTVGFMASVDLLRALREIEESPWRGMDLTAEQLARRLRPYGVRPGHNSAKTARGYSRESFGETFARYLPSEPVPPSGGGVSAQVTTTDGGKPDTRPDLSAELRNASVRTGQPVRQEVTRPSVSPGQGPSTDGRTGTDGQAHERGIDA